MPNTYRYAVRDATSRETWSFEPLPVDDHEAARQGWNVLGPALDLSGLCYGDRRDLIHLARTRRRDLTPQDAQRFAALMSTVPRLSAPGYDIDGDDARATRALALRLIDAEQKRGVRLRVAHSSGPDRAGLHLEFGPATPEAARPELLRTLMRRAGTVARQAGLVPAPGSNVSADGVAEFWIIPGTDPSLAKLDLKPLNKGARGRQGLFRPLGGLSKNGRSSKQLAHGLTCHGEPTPITVALLDEAPDPVEDDAGRSGALRIATRRRASFRPLPSVSSDISALVGALKLLRRPGDHHDLRLALCAVAQQNRILTYGVWTNALAQAWGDAEDARAAWHSTADRLAAGQPCKGATWLRRRLGTRQMAILALGIARTAQEPITEIMQRLGRPPPDRQKLDAIAAEIERQNEADAAARDDVQMCSCHDAREHSGERCPRCFGFATNHDGLIAAHNRRRELGLDTESLKDWLPNRLRIGGRCLNYRQDENCARCDFELTSSRMRCDWLELCQSCAVRYLSALELEVIDAWSDAGPIAVIFRDGYSSREEALAWARRATIDTEAGDRALTIPHATASGWALCMIVRDAPGNLGREALSPWFQTSETHRGCTAVEAARLAVFAIHMTGATIQEHIAAGRAAEAVEIIRSIYRLRRCYMVADGLPWPSVESVKDRMKPEHDDSDACECPADSGEHYRYTCTRTGHVVAESRERKSLSEVVNKHRKQIEAGAAPEEAPPPRRRFRDALRE